LDSAACDELAGRIGSFVPLDGRLAPIPDAGGLDLRRSRLDPPAALASICRADVYARAAHTYGKAYRDVMRNLRGELPIPPDQVAYPHDEAHVVALLEWAADAGAAVIPYGGGSSVVGGVECRDPDRPVICLDMSRMGAVLEVDEANLAVHAQGGAYGPAIEQRLRPHELTLRHYPQSFEFSTLGGWLATRAGGHYATGYTHIDDLVEAMRVVTPVGTAESLRVPASGAGPSPDRLWLGSEGTLGVISQAWLRVQRRPRYRAAAAVGFDRYDQAVAATREVAQSGLSPANCRLLDPLEAMLAAAVTDGTCKLLLGFESADHPVDWALSRAAEICRAHGGRPDPSTVDAAGSWRSTFLQAPYQRDALARLGVVVETFETACTWSGFTPLHTAVIAAVTTAAESITGSPAVVTCRLSHVYADGPAPYFTVFAAGRRGHEVAIWDELKAAASEVLLAHGATITHHHAIGRDHRPWYDRQLPDPFARALRGAKHALDPTNTLNPGTLLHA